MALIQLPQGCGKTGESIYHKLRELKRLHELSWGDEVFLSEQGGQATKKERGILLNNQRLNSIADMAAVLAGQGRGNLIWTSRTADASGRTPPSSTPSEAEDEAPEGKELLDVVVYWENELLRQHAQSWSPNVTHDLLENRPPEPSVERTGAEPSAEGVTEVTPA